MTVAARAACSGIRAYQRAASGRLPVCRHAPSCSAYALEAVEVHGAARGAWLALRRLVRCHPWSPLRCDPVPPRRRRLTIETTDA